jgi:hypothetical protein
MAFSREFLSNYQNDPFLTITGLVRFVPKSDESKVLIGEPVDASIDVGLALYEGKEVQVKAFTGSSILAPGEPTGNVETIKTVLSPLAQEEVGTIRCIGLNVSFYNTTLCTALK